MRAWVCYKCKNLLTRRAPLAAQGDVEGKGVVRPPWLGFAVHVLNGIVAWADLVVGRPARPPARRSAGFAWLAGHLHLCM